MKTILSLLFCATASLSFGQSDSLRNEIQLAVDRGLTALQKLQAEDGSWGEVTLPGLTAMPVMAFYMNPGFDPKKDATPPHIQKALDFIAKNQQSDGGIYGKGMGSYNTSLCVMALHLSGKPEFVDTILKARRFLINQQSDFDRKGKADNAFDGGIGYGGSYSHSDLSNSHLAMEALYYTKDLLKDAKVTKSEDADFELDWDAAIQFVQRCQNRTETNDQEWASDDEENKGGFAYFPGKSMAGDFEKKDGSKGLRSYGSMTYAGLLSFLYAELDKDDPRVKDAVAWAQKNYTVDENPKMGLEGHFYYLNTMSKAMSLAGVKEMTVDGKDVDWRVDLTKKLLNIQKPDGTWLNSVGRWYENEVDLVTSYAIMALSRAYWAL
jgi:squalene-hopene/tetraprenyl-beta-curcumene cyclase